MNFQRRGALAALRDVGLLKVAARRAAAAAPEPELPYEARLQRRFARLKAALRTYGEEVDTGHKRLLFPKRVLGEEDINNLGFVPVNLAIPEAGQSALRSFRHPDHKYHIHEHDDSWTMHLDEEPASTMLSHRANKNPYEGWGAKALRSVASTIKGLPHTVKEGLPGLAYYASGRIQGNPGMKERVIRDANPQVFQEMSTWKPLRPVTIPEDA